MRYTANPDELRKLASGLTDVAAGLGPAGRLDRLSTLAIGSSSVARALDQVGSNWSQARRRLRSDVEHLAQAVTAATASYAVVDDSAFAHAAPDGAGR